jgi:hypothetical protein
MYLTNTTPADFFAKYKDLIPGLQLNRIAGPWDGDLFNTTEKQIFAAIYSDEDACMRGVLPVYVMNINT